MIGKKGVWEYVAKEMGISIVDLKRKLLIGEIRSFMREIEKKVVSEGIVRDLLQKWMLSSCWLLSNWLEISL